MQLLFKLIVFSNNSETYSLVISYAMNQWLISIEESEFFFMDEDFEDLLN